MIGNSGMHGSMWGWAMTMIWILFLVLVVLGILALIKYIIK